MLFLAVQAQSHSYVLGNGIRNMSEIAVSQAL